MSAGLDVAAGVAGVASLGINAIDVALKIRDVCKAVKNAPAEIRGLLQEAELFHAIILEYSRRITTVAPSALHETAIRNCERNFDLLYSSLQELNAGLACKRNFWNSLKTMRKRETLEGLATKVERAKSSLVLVGLLHCMHIPQQKTTCVQVGNVRTLRPIKPCNPAPSLMSVSASQCAFSARLRYRIDLGIGKLDYFTQYSDDDDHTCCSQSEIRFTFEPWLSCLAVGIMSIRSHQKVSWNLTAYTFVPKDAAIFEACSRGDVIKVQHLFDNREASPWDVASDGMTPLHVAAAFKHPHLCRMLIDMGADVHAIKYCHSRRCIPLMLASNYYGWNFLDVPETLRPATCMSLIMVDEHIMMSLQETIQVLVEHGKAEIDMFWSPNSDEGQMYGGNQGDSVLAHWVGPHDSFSWLISEERLNLLGEELAEFYFWIALCGAFAPDPRVADLTTQRVSDLGRLARAINPWLGRTVLHGYLDHGSNIKYSEWPMIPVSSIRKILRAGADVHALSHFGDTPLMALAQPGFRAACERVDCTSEEAETDLRNQRQLINLWLSVLEEEGYDLDEYLQKEKELMAGIIMRSENHCCESHPSENGYSHDFVLKFEADASTGKLSVELVCHPCQHGLDIPGGWPDDSDESIIEEDDSEASEQSSDHNDQSEQM